MAGPLGRNFRRGVQAPARETSRVANFGVPSFEEFVQLAAAKNKHGSKRPRDTDQYDHIAAENKGGPKPPRDTDHQYDHMKEDTPDHPFFHLDREGIDTALSNIAEVLLDAIAGADAQDKQLSAIKLHAHEIKKVVIPKTADIAAVGLQGVGKSTLVNALQHRVRLSNTTSSGEAGTTFPVRFCLKADAVDMSDTFDAAIVFKDDSEIQEVTEEQIRNYLHYHYSDKSDLVDLESCRESAEAAEKFFLLIANADQDGGRRKRLESLLNLETMRNGDLTSFIIAQAQERIREAHADENRTISFSNIKGAHQAWEEMKMHITNRPGSPSLESIVHCNQIMLLSLLTKHGAYIVDLPGMNDANQARTATANATRREARYEMIVADSKRVKSDEHTHKLLREAIKAHGADRVLLVVTQKDDLFNDALGVDKEIETNKAYPFGLINIYKMDNEERLAALLEEEDSDNGKEVEQRKAYDQELLAKATLAMITLREEAVDSVMSIKFTKIDAKPIQVYHVSSQKYLEHAMVNMRTKPAMSIAQSGIPRLRARMLALCADNNQELYTSHVFDKLHDLLDECHRISESDQKDSSYARLCPTVSESVNELSKNIGTLFINFAEDHLSSVWQGRYEKRELQKDIDRNVVEDWNSVHHATYNGALPKVGIVPKTKCKKYVRDKPYGSFNWNSEVGLRISKDIDSWESQMRPVLQTFGQDLINFTVQTCKVIADTISTTYPAGAVRDTASNEWLKVHHRITKHSERLANKFEDALCSIHQYATTETDVRCMIAKINAPNFLRVSHVPYGTSYSSRIEAQRAAMRTEMGSPDAENRTLIDRIEHALLEKAKTTLQQTYEGFCTDIFGEFTKFNKHMGDRAPPDVPLTARQVRQRQKVLEVIPRLERMVASVQAKFAVEMRPQRSAALVSLEAENEDISQNSEPEEYWAEPPTRNSKGKQPHKEKKPPKKKAKTEAFKEEGQEEENDSSFSNRRFGTSVGGGFW